MTWPSHPTHVTGEYVIGDDIHGRCSANVLRDREGNEIGVYIDDSTPNIDRWVQVASEGCAHPLVLVSQPPGPGRQRASGPNVWNMKEIYTWGYGRPLKVTNKWYTPLPNYGGYIIQWNYRGPHGHNPVPKAVKDKWLKKCLAKSPKFGVWKF